MQAGNCALALNGATITYSACATLQGLPDAYRLYYTYDVAASTITAAFAYPNPTGWVAWGVNSDAPGQMLGGSALVVKSNSTASSGEFNGRTASQQRSTWSLGRPCGGSASYQRSQ